MQLFQREELNSKESREIRGQVQALTYSGAISNEELKETARIYREEIKNAESAKRRVRPKLAVADHFGIDLMIAEQISGLDQNVEVMSIEVTPANLSKSGVSLLQEISKKFNFFIPITKELENNADDLKIYSSLEDVIKICEQSKKTNLFVLKNLELAQKLCLRTNK